jgi:hypothetical protein
MRSSTKRSSQTPFTWIGIGAAFYLFCNLFLPWHTPILQSGDQVYFWMDAQRMLHGERAYVDFFQYTPPGTDLFFLALFKLFGARIWVLNVAVIILGVALSLVCFQIARQTMESRVALLCTAMYLVAIFSKPLNATHHWFSVLFLMSAVSVLLSNQSSVRMAIAGGFLALSFLFTHTHGIVALAAITIWLAWRAFEAPALAHQPTIKRPVVMQSAILCLSFVLTVFALYAHFLASAGVRRLWYQQVTYVYKYAVQGFAIPNLGMPAPIAWHNWAAIGMPLAVAMLLPVVYVVSMYRAVRGDLSTDADRNNALVSLVGLFLFVEVALSPNWLRIYAVSLPGIIAGVYLAACLQRSSRQIIALLTFGTACLSLLLIWSRQHHTYVTTLLPAGSVAISGDQYDEVSWIAGHTHPGDYFFQAAWPGLYIPLGLRNPLFLDTVGTIDQTRPDDIAAAIRQLDQRQVRYILWSARLDASEPPRPGDHLEPFRVYLHSHYDPVKSLNAGDTIWARKSF